MLNIQKLKDLFQNILDEYVAIILEAKGFGLRLAAIPRGMMSRQGVITLTKGTPKMFDVYVGYQADGDVNWGNIWVGGKRQKVFKNVVRKEGHTKLPKFVRELVEQVRALDDADATGVFRSGGGPRVSTYEVTANRKQVVLGEVKGWLFYGIASC